MSVPAAVPAALTTEAEPVVAVVDHAALAANVARLARLAAPSATMLAVKADAYGHGLVPVARTGLAAGATSLAVLEIDAGLTLREAGVEAPVFAWLHGPGTDFAAGVAASLELGISDRWQLDDAAAAGRHTRMPALVHLKADTGLGRGGASRADWPALVTSAVEAERRGDVRIRGLWSHLADASAEDDARAREEFERAVAVALGLGARPALLHLAASSAGIDEPEARYDLVRFGIAAYGVSPFDDRSAGDLGLTPVMTLATRVVEADGDGTATIGAGFAHGLHLPALPRAEVLVAGRRARVVSLGVTQSLVEAPDARPGDDVVVFGTGADGAPTAADWAGWAGTVGDEIVTRVATRVPRRHAALG